jgi:hypothetical protein
MPELEVEQEVMPEELITEQLEMPMMERQEAVTGVLRSQ